MIKSDDVISKQGVLTVKDGSPKFFHKLYISGQSRMIIHSNFCPCKMDEGSMDTGDRDTPYFWARWKWVGLSWVSAQGMGLKVQYDDGTAVRPEEMSRVVTTTDDKLHAWQGYSKAIDDKKLSKAMAAMKALGVL